MNKWIVLSLLFSGAANADAVVCETKTSFTIVEADRQSDPKYTDTFLIKFINAEGNHIDCGGSSYAYIENSSNAHDAIVSMAYMLAAQNKMAMIRIESNDTIGEAARIEYMYPKQ